MNRKIWYCLFFLSAIVIGSGCSDQPKTLPQQVATKTVVQKGDLDNFFRFHKLVEVSPGQYYDVLSWGRGSKNIGAFMILHSDSAGKKYTTTTGDLDGEIIDVYNSDMDLDGNPEILIQTKGKDTSNYTTILAFEFTYGKAQKLSFPKLTQSQQKGYRGGDNFYIKDGQFYREFPLYDGTGAQAKANGQKRLLEYGLRNNSFTVKQVSKDSTKAGAVKPVEKVVEKKTVTVKKTKKAKKHKKRGAHHHYDGEKDQ
jgi:hypothetical protein